MNIFCFPLLVLKEFITTGNMFLFVSGASTKWKFTDAPTNLDDNVRTKVNGNAFARKLSGKSSVSCTKFDHLRRVRGGEGGPFRPHLVLFFLVVGRLETTKYWELATPVLSRWGDLCLCFLLFEGAPLVGVLKGNQEEH